MPSFIRIILSSNILLFASLAFADSAPVYTLTVSVDGLRNANGVVQFALYNQDGSIPDEDYERYFKKKNGKITNRSSKVVFKDLPKGRYAINILHDENKNGKIDKGFILPVEGVGFSGYSSIGLTNRPKFSKASFQLNSDTAKTVKIIYF